MGLACLWASKKKNNELREELAIMEELEELGPQDPEIYNRKMDIQFELNETLANEEWFILK